MKKLLLGALLFMATSVVAQDKDVKRMQNESSRTIKKENLDTIAQTWRRGGQFSVTLAQGSLRNWAAGGDEFSLSINSMLSLFSFYEKGRNSWDNTFDFNFGYVNTTSLGPVKTMTALTFYQNTVMP
jgi:hypothetical protein